MYSPYSHKQHEYTQHTNIHPFGGVGRANQFFLSLTMVEPSLLHCISGGSPTMLENLENRNCVTIQTAELTFGNNAVHKSHGEAKEDKVMQVVHLEDKNIWTRSEVGKGMRCNTKFSFLCVERI